MALQSRAPSSDLAVTDLASLLFFAGNNSGLKQNRKQDYYLIPEKPDSQLKGMGRHPPCRPTFLSDTVIAHKERWS